ncbi:MAG TPA: hypothetical protein VJ697_15550 [Nitrososphaeraceae archaeon]|nr:hypothetical protein [Nitrososphaeraceae archaeon]
MQVIVTMLNRRIGNNTGSMLSTVYSGRKGRTIVIENIITIDGRL